MKPEFSATKVQTDDENINLKGSYSQRIICFSAHVFRIHSSVHCGAVHVIVSTPCRALQSFTESVEMLGGGRVVSEDLEALEQSECGSPPFALRSGRLHCDQLGGGRGRQLLVAGGGEGGEQCFVFSDVDGWYQAAALPSLPRPPHRLVEDPLHREEVQTGRHLEEQTAITSRQSLALTLTHLPERGHDIVIFYDVVK